MSDKREGNEFPCVSCVFRWFQRNWVKCYVSVQVTYLLDTLTPLLYQPLDGWQEQEWRFYPWVGSWSCWSVLKKCPECQCQNQISFPPPQLSLFSTTQLTLKKWVCALLMLLHGRVVFGRSAQKFLDHQCKKKTSFPLLREIRFLLYVHQSERKCTTVKTYGRVNGNRSSRWLPKNA